MEQRAVLGICLLSIAKLNNKKKKKKAFFLHAIIVFFFYALLMFEEGVLVRQYIDYWYLNESLAVNLMKNYFEHLNLILLASCQAGRWP